jgi:glycerol-3-phosphate dehydrogenase
VRTEFEIDPNDIKKEHRQKVDFKLKSRDEHMKNLMDPDVEFDLLIVGGGANGTGVALDASSRGLKVAVIDAHDFAGGTSSKSTKMAHGGIRYFQQMCLLQGDPIESYCLLKETLNERNYFLKTAPYLIKELPLLIPSQSLFWNLFWYYPGCVGYHLIYMKQLLSSNFEVSVSGPSLLSKAALRQQYPMVKPLHGQWGSIMCET